MLASIFTPTHDPRHLVEAHESLKAQTIDDFEWVIAPNGAAVIPATVLSDPRVKVHPLPDANHGIGALKKFACSRCAGELFVELDHDDLLAPDALARLIFHYRQTPDGFYYSDFVNFTPDGGSYPDDAQRASWIRSGWEFYPHEWRGSTYQAARAFAPCPRSLHQIFWAPNHVRAWSRAAYYKSGGHDPALPVIDDLDLVCRTYLKGTPFVHIPEVLYYYRQHDNTYLKRRDEIARRSQDTSNAFTYQLIDEWCRRHALAKLDLGGAHNAPRGYTTVDRREPADLVCDIENGLPLSDSSCGAVRAFDFLEHVHADRVVAVLNEIYRVLAPGGWLITQTPSTDGRGAFCDPTHRSFWNRLSWRYYCNAAYAKYVPEIECRFQAARLWDTPVDRDGVIWTCADLVALKGQRVPGPVEI